MVLYLFTEAKSDDDDDDDLVTSVTWNCRISHFFESCSGAAWQLWAVHQLLLNVWRHNYPQLTNAFIKAISALSSLAAAEHLFSAAGHILCGRHCKLSDKHFEMFVFLRDFVSWTVYEWCTAGCSNLFEEQFDVCVFKRFPKQTLYFTNAMKYLHEAPECWRKRGQKLDY